MNTRSSTINSKQFGQFAVVSGTMRCAVAARVLRLSTEVLIAERQCNVRFIARNFVVHVDNRPTIWYSMCASVTPQHVSEHHKRAWPHRQVHKSRIRQNHDGVSGSLVYSIWCGLSLRDGTYGERTGVGRISASTPYRAAVVVVRIHIATCTRHTLIDVDTVANRP